MQGNDGRPEGRLTGLSGQQGTAVRPVFRPAGFKGLSDNQSLQLEYVRLIHNIQAQKEIVFAISLPADTRATTVFNAVKKFYEEKEIPMQNVLQCAAHGAATMVGKHREFIAFMKKKTWIHCNSMRYQPAAFGHS